MEPKKIMVVEDHPGVREITMMLLANLFPRAEIFQAENGEIGWEQYNIRKPDLVFTDLKMPKMNGNILLKKIKEQNPDTVVILVSGEDELILREVVGSSGAFFLQKPASIIEIREIVSSI
jgi:DNA-binding NarL/FixJ family response regulator